MTHTPIHAQKGFGFLGLIFWVVFLGSLLLVGMKTLPIGSEYMAIKSAIKIAKSAGDAAAIRSSFDQQAKAGYHNDFTGRELLIENNAGVVTVSFAYQRIVPLAGPVSLMFDLSGKELAR